MAKKQSTNEAAVAVVTKSENGFAVVDLTKGVPLLNNAEAAPFDLVGDYWTPENVGETRRLYFSHITDRLVKDEETGESVPLACAFFVEPTEQGLKSICNASKRLVGAMENAKIEKGTPLEIRYLGKKKNNSNAFKSDLWSIKPLMINITQ